MTKVLLASRISSSLRFLQQCLAEQNEFEVQTRLINNGHTDPLHGLRFQPDVVVLSFDAEHLAELAAWTGKDSAARPPLIVVGPAGQAEAMRLAIRSGAKDFLAEPVVAADLIAALQRVRDDAKRLSRGPRAAGSVHAIVGAAGGVGTSFIATNIARLLADNSDGTTATAPMLVDLDLNFAPLSHYLDMRPDRGLLQALEAPEGLDELALAGFGAKHRSGLRLLCASSGPAVLSKDVSAEKLAQLMEVLATYHSQVIVDLPHVLDSLTATVFSVSTNVVLVLQQSLLHVRNAARLLQILRTELGVPSDRIRVLVNRYQKDALVQMDDIRRSLNTDAALTIPGDYRSALESADAGVPLCEVDRNSPMARALRQLLSALTGENSVPRSGLLRRVFHLSSGTEP
jgi:pilus assembly protein CpaE